MPKLDDRKKDYDVLGLDTTANQVEVKKAFTRLALKYHPDSHSVSKIIGQENHLYIKSKFQEVCKAYKKIMAEENCSVSDWNNDKSDEIFFSLLGELLQNSTRAGELYTLLSSQANSRSQFQNDNEYRCKEDAMEDDDEESELNKLVDILKNRLQNGKSVPAGLTQEKLTRLKDDFIKQKEENKRTEQNQHTPTKKPKTTVPVPVAKPKPKNKKQLQAEQRRREIEMAKIATELEEKKKKDEEKDQVRKKQDKERKLMLEEESKKHEEDKKKQLNESRKKKERDEKEKEQKSQKEKERNERYKKSQEEEQRKKEEEKRRKVEEKAAKQKAMKESKEREELEKVEKQQTQKTKARSQQYQQYQQQQQKYPREVPPRFLRAQQQKQQVPRKEQDYIPYTNDNNQFRDGSRWTEIVPDTQTDHAISEDWDIDINDLPSKETISNDQNANSYVEPSWGGGPASEDWDLDANKLNTARSSVTHSTDNRSIQEHSIVVSEQSTVVKSLFGPSDPPLPSTNTPNGLPPQAPLNDTSWGASLTGSTWDSGNAAKQWEANASSNVSKSSVDDNNDKSLNGNVLENSTQSSYAQTSQNVSKTNPNWNKPSKPLQVDSMNTGSPGITPWAGLDSFDGGPTPNVDTIHNSQIVTSNNTYSGGAKPKTTPVASFHSYQSDTSDKNRIQTQNIRTSTKLDTNDRTEKRVNVPSIDNKVDSNLKVTGWLQNSAAPSEDWEEEEKECTDGDGWTTVSLKTKKPPTGGSQISSAPGTPSKADGSNAWTNRALKQLLDMGFMREQAEKALRDNNGIIESAVSDLLMKGDCTEPITSQTPSEQKPSTSKLDDGLNNDTNTETTGTTPQKLNRKQRRKLQQMQMAEQAKESPNVTTNSVNPTTAIEPTAVPAVESNVRKGRDGLLPTPPPSHRLIPNEVPVPAIDKVISRPVTSKAPGAEASAQKSIQRPNQSQTVNSMVDISQNSVAQQPIGTRPTQPNSIQPPTPTQLANFSQSSQSVNASSTVDQMNGTTLNPPVNPVLLAQIHLQKLGLEDAPAPPVSFNTPVSSVTSQAVTNTMIQQYLQQIAQAPEIETAPSVSAASMHLSELLQQAPIPASSLSEGPTKSKLLQWTQTNSASNSEPTTPPSDETKEGSFPPRKIDPVSAKWGVLAAPRLSPTPAEFKPGVPWRSRAEPGEENEVEDYDINEAVLPNANLPNTNLPNKFVSQDSVSPSLLSNQQNVKPPANMITTSSVLSSTAHLQQPMVVRPPPGLMTSEVKPRPADDMCWLILKGITSAVDPSPIRSLCQQFGTLLHFRVIGNGAYIRYETAVHAKNAWASLNGRIVFNTQILAEISSEDACMKTMEAASLASDQAPSVPLPITNQVSQMAPGFANISSFGGLWTTPGQPAPPPAQPLYQQSFPTTYGAPTTIGMNGGFSHWGMPTGQPVIPNTSQLWGPAPPPQQPQSNVYQAYPGWLTTKPDVPMQANMFSPGMDHCLPSELFGNMKEQSS